MAGLPEPIGYGEILDFVRCTNTDLHPKEVEILIGLDAEYRVWEAEQRKRPPSDDED